MNIGLRQVLYSLGIVGVMLLSSNVYSQPPVDHFNQTLNHHLLEMLFIN